MTFDQSHWKRPRATIATKYEHNDIAYATHGAQQAMLALKMLDLRPSEAAKLSILDVGCGTGRMARILAFQFYQVFGYDPVQECIDLARRECVELDMPNTIYTTDPNHIPIVDCAICVNVIEHLDPERSRQLLDLIESKLTPNGRYVLWYSLANNAEVMATRLTPEQQREDLAKLRAGGGISVRVLTATK